MEQNFKLSLQSLKFMVFSHKHSISLFHQVHKYTIMTFFLEAKKQFIKEREIFFNYCCWKSWITIWGWGVGEWTSILISQHVQKLRWIIDTDINAKTTKLLEENRISSEYRSRQRFIFRSLIHSEFIFVNGVMSVQLHSFPFRYSVFPAPFAETTILSLLNGFATLVEKHPTTCARVYFLALCVITLACVSVFMPVPHCFDYFSFVESFEISKYETSNFLLFQDCFWLFGVHWILNFTADFFLLL